MDGPDEAPGWDAIERALEELFPDQRPHHWGSNTLPNQRGIYGLSAYRTAIGWLYVTFGLSELFDKVSDDRDVSGWGIELTMRVISSDPGPPQWPVRLLNKLGRYVYDSRNTVAAGHRLDPGGPINGEPDCGLTALAFATDPQLPSLSTPNGRVDFITVVGITAAELAEARSTSTAAVLDRLSPLYETDLGRAKRPRGGT